ncbi:MAG: STAS domain-containing protein [Bacteroidota bacterium]
MKLSTHARYHAHVVTVKGRFLGSVHKATWNQTIASVGAGKNLIIDLSGTDFMDSSAIGLCINTAKQVRAEGGDVVLANLTKRIKNLFVMTRLLGDVFPSYDSLDAAEQHFHAASPAS